MKKAEKRFALYKNMDSPKNLWRDGMDTESIKRYSNQLANHLIRNYQEIYWTTIKTILVKQFLIIYRLSNYFET